MSPEQLDGQPLTPQSDIFSLGAILAYAGTGHLPFGGSTIPAIAAQILSHQPNLDSLTGVAGLAAGLGVLVFNKHPATISSATGWVAATLSGPTGLATSSWRSDRTALALGAIAPGTATHKT